MIVVAGHAGPDVDSPHFPSAWRRQRDPDALPAGVGQHDTPGRLVVYRDGDHHGPVVTPVERRRNREVECAGAGGGDEERRVAAGPAIPWRVMLLLPPAQPRRLRDEPRRIA